MTHGNDMKFKFQCPSVKFHWHTSTLLLWGYGGRDLVWPTLLGTVPIGPFTGQVVCPLVWRSEGP